MKTAQSPDKIKAQEVKTCIQRHLITPAMNQKGGSSSIMLQRIDPNQKSLQDSQKFTAKLLQSDVQTASTSVQVKSMSSNCSTQRMNKATAASRERSKPVTERQSQRQAAHQVKLERQTPEPSQQHESHSIVSQTETSKTRSYLVRLSFAQHYLKETMKTQYGNSATRCSLPAGNSQTTPTTTKDESKNESSTNTKASQALQDSSPEPKNLAQARRERSESRTRRVQLMSEGEKQAFLQECQNIQNLVRASVQNLNKIISNDPITGDVTQNRRSLVFTPKRSSLGHLEWLGVVQQTKAQTIQRWIMSLFRKRKTLKKVKSLAMFKQRLLAVYKGWVVRQKVMKTFMIRQQIKDIKALKTKYLQQQAIKSSINQDKQQVLKKYIRVKTQTLIDRINDYQANRRYLKKNSAQDTSLKSLTSSLVTPLTISPRPRFDESESALSSAKSNPILKISSSVIVRAHQFKREPVQSPKAHQKNSVITNEQSETITDDEEIDKNCFCSDTSKDQQSAPLCSSIDNYQQQSPKSMLRTEKLSDYLQTKGKATPGFQKLSILSEKKPVGRVQNQKSVVTRGREASTSRKLMTPKQESKNSGRMPSDKNQFQFGRQSLVSTKASKKDCLNTSLNASRDQGLRHLNSDLEDFDEPKPRTKNQREASKTRRSYLNAAPRIDCWRKDQSCQRQTSSVLESNQPKSPNLFTINLASRTQTEGLITSEESSLEPKYEQVLSQMRSIMLNLERSAETGQSRQQIKIEMERCFIEMRREFDLRCLEKFGTNE